MHSKLLIFAAHLIGITLLGLLALSPYIHARPFAQTDLIAYRTATEVATEHSNPYSPEMILAREQGQGYTNPEPMMVWNPPPIFSLLSPLLLVPYSHTQSVWNCLTVLAASLLAMLGVSSASNEASTTRSVRAPPSLLTVGVTAALVTSFTPLKVELSLGQISTVLTAILALGGALFLKKRDFSAGLVLSIAIIKPHLAFLPLLVVGVWILRQHRWRAIVGCVVGLTLLFAAAEMQFSGITSLWLTRKSWPTAILGTNLFSLLSIIAAQHGVILPAWVSVAITGIATPSYLVWRWKKLRDPRFSEIAIACIFSPIIAPYGFIFDQSSLLIVSGYIVGRALHASRPFGLASTVLICAASAAVGLTLGDRSLGIVPLFAFVTPFVLLALFALVSACETRFFQDSRARATSTP